MEKYNDIEELFKQIRIQMYMMQNADDPDEFFGQDPWEFNSDDYDEYPDREIEEWMFDSLSQDTRQMMLNLDMTPADYAMTMDEAFLRCQIVDKEFEEVFLSCLLGRSQAYEIMKQKGMR